MQILRALRRWFKSDDNTIEDSPPNTIEIKPPDLDDPYNALPMFERYALYLDRACRGGELDFQEEVCKWISLSPRKTMTHVMIDTETLGFTPGCSILTLGAAVFNPEDWRNEENMQYFYVRIHRQSCLNLGLKEEQSTLDWWDKQSEEARYEVFGHPDRVTITEALALFDRWLGEFPSQIRPWSHGVGFDIPIIEHAYRRAGKFIPWNYFNALDTRTIYWKAGFLYRDPRLVQPKIPHHALEDAIAQAKTVQKAHYWIDDKSLISRIKRAVTLR